MGRSGRRPVRVVVVGAGVAALEATLALHELAEERVTIELLAPEREFTYRPLAVAEPFRVAEIRRFPLEPLVLAAGAALRAAVVVAVDAERRLVRTSAGDELSYDLLLLALGACPREALPGALTFRGPGDVPALSSLLEQAVNGEVRRLAFALPAAVAWTLPLYELALLTWSFLSDRGAASRELVLVTPEAAPLELFGRSASDAVRELLTMRRIGLRLQTTPLRFQAPTLHLVRCGTLAADAVVALAGLVGPRLAGVPHDAQGFVRTDEHGRVGGLDDVYAAGDLTTFPVKQGGIATQQADAAAEAIAARAGAPLTPEPFRPVLRGQLLTGIFPRYLHAEPGREASTISTEPLWSPPAKIVGRHLAPFLTRHLGLPQVAPRPTTGIPVDVALERSP
jgi:sulfide:quinone oxidoreductase